MTYEETAALMVDAVFNQRTQVACLHFADYISGEDKTVPAHNTRMKWASQTFQTPNMTAVQLMPVLVMDPKVQTDGAAITDTDLQSAVETSVNKTI